MTNAASTRLDPAELSGARWKALNECALWIQGAADLDTLQAGVLENVARVIEHRASMFDMAQTGAHGKTEFVHPAARGMTAEQLSSYYERYAAYDYTIWSFDMRHVHVYRDLDLVDAERRNATPIYQEWMEPLGIYFGCTATLAHENTPLGTLTLFRERAAGDFTDEELEALRQIARHLSLCMHRHLPHGFTEGADADPVAALAARAALLPRETEVLRLMLAGKTNHDMAAELFISESTIKKHVNAIYRKLGVKNRMGLMALLRP